MPNMLKIGIMLCLLSLHFGLIYLLYTYKPSKLSTYARAKPELAESDSVMVIQFITRPSARKTIKTGGTAEIRQNNASAQASLNNITKADATDDATPSASFDELPDTQLILSPPEPRYDFTPPPRDLTARPKNPLEPQTTRFSKSWKPDGNAIDSLKWNSNAINAIFGLFGGNAKICTDEDRRQRNPECVPDGFQPEK